MKKMLTWIMTVLLAVGVLAGAVAEKPVKTSLEDEYEWYAVESAAVLGSTLYYVSGQDIISIEPDRDPEVYLCLHDYEEIHINHSFAYQLLLFVNGDRLYMLCSTSGELYDITDGNPELVVTLDTADLGEQWDEGRYIAFGCPAVLRDNLYLLYVIPENYSQQADILQFSLKDGKRAEISNRQHNPQELVRYKDQLLVLNEECNVLLAVDTDAKQITDEAVFTLGDKQGMAVVYDESDDSLYYASGTTVYSEKDGKPEVVDRLYFTEQDSFFNAVLWNGKYSIYYNKGLFVCDKDGNSSENQTVLRLYASEGVVLPDGVFTDFMYHHPEVLIEKNYFREENFNEMLMQIMMDKNSGADLVLLNSNEMDFATIISKGYAAAIGNEDLRNDAEKMYPQIRGYLSSDDVLYGYPASLVPFCWSVNDRLMGKAGFQALPATVNEYLDMMLEWLDNDGNGYPGYRFSDAGAEWLWYDFFYLARKYVLAETVNNGGVRFNTPEFREIMEKYPQILDKMKEVYTEQNWEDPILFTMDNYMPITNISYEYNAERLMTPIRPPVFSMGQEPVMEGQLGYFFIYSQSEHKEEAEHFLNFFAGCMAEPDLYLIYPGINEPKENSVYQYQSEEILWEINAVNEVIKEIDENGEDPDDHMLLINGADVRYSDYLAGLEKELEALESIRWAYSEEEIQDYKKVAGYLRLEQGPFIERASEQAANILIDYINGTKTLDQALDAADQVVAMMYNEEM